jgi:urease accessory protein
MVWLDVLQMVDSSFPSGAYAHSFGLETLAPSDLGEALKLRLEESLARLELVFARHAYTHDLLELDDRLHASLLVREPREASSVVGASLLRSACLILPDARLHQFLEAGRHHHQAVVFGAVAAAIELPPEMAGQAYAFSTLRAQVSAAQRLGWIGQREAQRVLHRLKPAVRLAASRAAELALDEAGAFTPLWDIACMQHERAPARMFAS